MIARVPRRSTPARAAGLGPRVSRSTPADARAFVMEVQRTAGNRALRSFLRSRTTRLQRDLSAYGKARAEFVPSMGEAAGVLTTLSESAEAAGLRAALAKLIEEGKVKEVTSAGERAGSRPTTTRMRSSTRSVGHSPRPATTKPTSSLAPSTTSTPSTSTAPRRRPPRPFSGRPRPPRVPGCTSSAIAR